MPARQTLSQPYHDIYALILLMIIDIYAIIIDTFTMPHYAM